MRIISRGHLPPKTGDEITCPYCNSHLEVETTDHFQNFEGWLWTTTCPACSFPFLVDDDLVTYKTPPPRPPSVCGRPSCRKWLNPLTTGQHIIVSPDRRQLLEVCSDCRDLLLPAGWRLEAGAKGRILFRTDKPATPSPQIVFGAEELDGSDIPTVDYDSTPPSQE